MQNISFDFFIDPFLKKIREFELIHLDDFSRQSQVVGYMKVALSRFQRVSDYNFFENMDEKNEVFNIEILDEDLYKIYDIADIISDGMVSLWVTPYYYNQENLENNLSTNDFKEYSAANQLEKVGECFKTSTKNFERKCKNHSYEINDLTSLNL